MSQVNMCRLCATACNDYERLCDDQGQHNEIYDITVKYFHPMFLKVAQDNQQLSVVCLGCWWKIYDFHKFQNDVVQTQIKLLKSAMQTGEHVQFQINVKSEQCQIDTPRENDAAKVDDQDPHQPELELKEGDQEQNLMKIEIMNTEIVQTQINPLKRTAPTDDEHVQLPAELNEEQFPIDTTCENGATKAEDQALYQSELQLNEGQPEQNIFKIKVMNAEFVEYTYSHGGSSQPTVKDESEEMDVSVTESFDCNFSADEGSQTNEITSHNVQQNTPSQNSSTPEEQGGINLPSAGVHILLGKRKLLEQLKNFITQWEPSLMCSGCGYACASLDKLRKHFHQNEPNGVCHILCCQQRLDRLEAIKTHLHLHMDPNAFQCKLCGKSTENAIQLNSHMFHQHPKRSKVCNRFGDFLARRKPTLECPECNESCSSFSLLQDHFYQRHPNVKCYILCCGSKFFNQCQIKDHIRHHMAITLKCEFCEKLYNHRGYLISHTISQHANATLCGNVKPKNEYPCAICGESCKDLGDLRDHIGKHKVDDCHKCPHCARSFRLASGLNNHSKKHHPKQWSERNKWKISQNK